MKVRRLVLVIAIVLIAALAGVTIDQLMSPNIVNGHFVAPSQTTTSAPQSVAAPTTSRSSHPPLPSRSITSSTSSPSKAQKKVTGCAGPVVGVVIPSLGVSAKTVAIGLESDGTLQAPSDANRQFVGVYIAGPKPGNTGNVLLDGHTYLDGSSVFHSDFGDKVKVGAVVRLVKRSCTYTYRVDKVWPTLAKQKQWVTPTAPFFGDVVRRYNLFRGTGVSGLTLMTCSGKFDYSLGHHEDEAVVHATLISIS